jgi:hypothetical protein
MIKATPINGKLTLYWIIWEVLPKTPKGTSTDHWPIVIDQSQGTF